MQIQRNTRPGQNMHPRQKVGLVVLVCTSVLPALLMTSFIPSFGFFPTSFSIWMIVALTGGVLGGSIMTPNPRYWYVGGIAGLLIGPGMLLATYYYTAFRHHLLSIEIFIPIVIGALPGLIFLTIVAALVGKRRRAQKLLSQAMLPANVPPTNKQ